MHFRFDIQNSIRIILLSIIIFTCIPALAQTSFVYQSPRQISIIKTVDVLVVGGTIPAVEAAISAKESGASVFLVESKPYLGEDLCATLRLKNQSQEKTELEKKIYNGADFTTPMQVKGVLSQALVDAGVEFIFGSFVTDILLNENEQPAGVVIANRAGRQAIVAKTIIDATRFATVCQLAGAEFEPWNDKKLEFERTLMLPGKSASGPLYEIKKLSLPMPDLSFASFANAEQLAREQTYSENQLRAAEELFFIPPNPVKCKSEVNNWQNSNQKTNHFQPIGFDNLFILNNYAQTPKPLKISGSLSGFGKQIGKEAALISEKSIPSKKLSIKPRQNNAQRGDIKEILTGIRSTKEKYNFIESPESGVPILGEYDVVVIGGGTSGTPAAISAARMGMKVLVVEYLEGLGGIGTLGMIGKAYHGKKVGFAAEVPFPDGNIEPKMEWYRKELEKAGAEIWLGAIGCGALVNENKVEGAAVVTPQGRGVVKAKVVIDATGNADIAIAAGAEYRYGTLEKNDIAIQGTGFSSRPLTGNYYNSDYLLVDENDMTDVWRSLVSVHITKKNEKQFDAVPMVQNREHRRVAGDFTLNYLDQIAVRTFPDAIVFSGSDYDSHGYPSSPYFALLPHDEKSKKENHPAPGGTCYTPYRCLLPKGLDGILVTGLGISMDRDASAMIRMQFDMANQGYAAGIAASMSITEDKNLREISIRELQSVLVEKGNLSDEVLKMKDNFPLSKKEIKEAVLDYGNATNPKSAGKPLAIILSHKNKALPFVKNEFKKAKNESQLLYAKLLGMCGEDDGVSVLISELQKIEKWDDKIYQGYMADFAHLPTPQDGIILALGNSGDQSTVTHLIKLVEKLDTSVTLSHHRSLALALEKLASAEAAKPLAELLQKPGMSGHFITNIDNALTELENNGKGSNPKTSNEKRTRAIRELVLARTLYTCGDFNEMGKEILINYQSDFRGIFSSHANTILNK